MFKLSLQRTIAEYENMLNDLKSDKEKADMQKLIATMKQQLKSYE